MSRVEINRANARHSTGPKTKAGKHRSSLNALRHGLTGQIIVLPAEDLEAYQRHIQCFVREYKPKGATESHLVQSLADCAWRQSRVSALENNLLTLGIARQPDPLDDAPQQVQDALAIAAGLDSQTRALSNLSIHGQRLARQFEKTLALLSELQSARRVQEHFELSQAANLTQMHRMKEEPYDPADDGFVFSKKQIEALLVHDDRDQRAADAEEYCLEAA